MCVIKYLGVMVSVICTLKSRINQQSMKERSNLNVIFVMLAFYERDILIHILQQSMKERNNSNVKYVILNSNQNLA